MFFYDVTMKHTKELSTTVNSEIFARVFFFVKIKSLRNGEIIMLFIDIGISYSSCEF